MVRRNHPGTTNRFADGLPNHVDLLKDFPYLGVPVHAHPNVRRLQHSPLHVYYRVLPENRKIEILHFWHEARARPSF
jgi:plasmid stabilization system protein ParE